MKLTFIHLSILIILSLFLRTVFLDRIPTGITEDELDYVLNAKAIAVTGTDISQTWSPFSLSTPPYEVPKAEIPYLLIAPYFMVSPSLSLLNARIPYALLSVFFVVIMYLLGRKIINKDAGFIIGLVTAVNPWSIYFGRTAYDTPLAVYFYFTAFYVLLIAKKYRILLAFPFFALAFFSYIGTKVLYIPFAATTIFYSWWINKKKYLKQYIILSILCLIPLIYFLLSIKGYSVGLRTGELISLNSSSIVNTVNIERKATIQHPFSNLFVNKLTVLGRNVIDNYLEVFSTNYLFLYGDNSVFMSLWSHGIFYYIDVFFLIFGAYYIFKTNRKLLYCLIAILLIGPLPSILSAGTKSYSIRASISFSILIIFIGCGIWAVLTYKKTKLYRYIAFFVIGGAYAFMVLNFINLYLFRHPIYNSEAFGLSQRLIARYVKLAQEKNQNVLYLDFADNPYFFKQYIFFSNGYSKKTASSIARVVKGHIYPYENLTIGTCPNEISDNMIIIAKPENKCPALLKIKNYLSIPLLYDGGEIYRIYNDKICSQYSLSRYPYNFSIDDFVIEKLSTKRFCEKFITNLTLQ